VNHSQQPPAAGAGRPRNRTAFVALAVATVALLLGTASTVISTMALANSRTAPVPVFSSTGGQGKDVAAPSATPATAPSSPRPTAPASPEDIDPSGAYTVAYQKQRLRVVSYRCRLDTATVVDFDEPRVNPASDRGDAGYSDCNPGNIVSSLPLAIVSSPDASPADCLEQIRTQPARSPVAVSKGLTICFLTDANKATAQGISRKLVFLTVDAFSVESEAGVLNFTLTAWNVPT
jgi:hypothetical protein